ncbi:prenyltransferase/squalene oxidase repeat-containing protein [Actinoplanes flavus]|uniref:Prenyltransferase n=1 Tax=Actinoplanes flavus TaxID=2820290 RepID=A0ABS3URD5_9ACTN|nr:prenyltransferase/squalene oxidase repeat-containing protein [Actinoplanes flavus]MBO3741335.1 prenyltransferase [Actinoplanes flavus]
MSSPVNDQVDGAVGRAADALFAVQRAEGSWPNRRPTAVLGTAGAAIALHLADRDRSAGLTARAVHWLGEAQNPDGGWGGVAGAPSQVIPTVIAASALRIIAPETTHDRVRRALDLVHADGGPTALNDAGMAHMASAFLTLAGLPAAGGARRIPLELLLLPARLWRARLSFRMAPFVAMAFMQSRGRPVRGPRRLARRAGLRLLSRMERQENDPGGYGGDNWLVAVVCIGLVSAGAPQEMIARTVDYLRANVHPDGSWHIMQGLDVIGGAYVARGLADAGYTGDARLAAARRWLRGCQQSEAFPLYASPPGGWGWEGPRGWPNILDSASVLAALVVAGGEEPGEVTRLGLRWLVSRQDRSGSWGTFVPDTTLRNDGPCPYVTAACLETLIDSGAAGDPAVRRGLDWLLGRQRPDGTYEALWYRGPVPGTAMALAAFGRAGMAGHPGARRARDALLRAQLPDGGWGPGDTGVPGDDPTGTVEETAWAVRALLVSGMPADDPRIRRGVAFIVAAQRPDGLWPAAPVCMHIRDAAYYVDGLIVDGLSLRALGAYRAARHAAAVAGSEVS